MVELIPNTVKLYAGWLSESLANICYKDLLAETSGKLVAQMVYGNGRPYRTRDHLMGRFGDPGVTYSYKDTRKAVHPLTPCLKLLQHELIDQRGFVPNCAVVNFYTPKGSLYPHRDGQHIPELGENPTIVSISLGATRTFRLHQLKDGFRTLGAVDIKLSHGDLLLCYGDFDGKWHHSMPAEPEASGDRLSITFRKHEPC